MKIEDSEIRSIKLTELDALDPITVMIEDYEPGKGEITINCYGESWSAYWGAMAGDNIITFFKRCDASYLISKLAPGLSSQIVDPKNPPQSETELWDPSYVPNPKYQYLERIVKAVQAAFNQLTKSSNKQQATSIQ